MRVGYARVAQDDERFLEAQQKALRGAGCERLFTDQAASPTLATRQPGLVETLSQLGQGDVLVVWRLDRLGRTVKGLLDLVDRLAGQGVAFVSLTEGIDTTAAQGQFLETVAALRQMEQGWLAERSRAGLAAARQRGRIGGRRRRMTPDKLETARRLLAEGIPPRDVARHLAVSIPTLYRWLPAGERASDNNKRTGP